MSRAAPSRTIAAVAVAAVLITSACRQGPRVEQMAPRGQIPAGTVTGDTAFAAMNERGKAVMGLDQYASTHKFVASADGGRIVFTSDTGADADVRAIRTHLKAITAAFSKGDFTDPQMIHMGPVPGVDVMKERMAVIRYTYADISRGGEVRIATKDAAALKAVHAFLEFQRTAHHTHEM